MKAILRDFYRSNLSLLIRAVLITAVCALCLDLTGMYGRDNTRIAAIVITAFLALSLVRLFIQVFAIAPAQFKKRLAELTEKERAEVLGRYADSVEFGSKRIYSDIGFFLYFAGKKIHLLRFGDIAKADMRSGGVNITMKDASEYFVPVGKHETAEMFWGMIHARNACAEQTIGGRPKDEVLAQTRRNRTGDN